MWLRRTEHLGRLIPAKNAPRRTVDWNVRQIPCPIVSFELSMTLLAKVGLSLSGVNKCKGLSQELTTKHPESVLELNCLHVFDFDVFTMDCVGEPTTLFLCGIPLIVRKIVRRPRVWSLGDTTCQRQQRHRHTISQTRPGAFPYVWASLSSALWRPNPQREADAAKGQVNQKEILKNVLR